MSDITYVCGVCGNQVKAEKGRPVPVCCKKEMGPLPYCTSVPNPEMARNYELDEPCDDGTSAKKS